jgi:hypothetical protein
MADATRRWSSRPDSTACLATRICSAGSTDSKCTLTTTERGALSPIRRCNGSLSSRLVCRVASLARRRSRQVVVSQEGHEVVPVETIAAERVAVNGCSPEPLVEPIPVSPQDPRTDRLSWTAPGRPPGIVYRVQGGGHGWPGGTQYAPRFVVGGVPHHLDATGLLRDFARKQLRGA